MPMHEFRNVGFVHNVDGDVLAFAHPQQWARDFIVVADCADDNLRSQLNQHGRDLQGEIRRRPGGLGLQGRHRMLRRLHTLLETWGLAKRGPQLACSGRDHGGASKTYKIPSLHLILTPAANTTI
jgi:hypothetical protein